MDIRMQQESDKIRAALLNPATTKPQYDQLYAAQQALSWASDPRMARSPFDTILLGPVTEVGPEWTSPAT